MHRSTLFLALLLAGAAHAADPLSPKELAVVDREMGKEMGEIEKKYGNKKPNELTLEERRGYTHDRSAAERKVLDRLGVDAKAYTNRVGKLSRSERDEVKAASDALEAKEKADKKKAEAAKEAAATQQEVTVQRGFNENAPVTVEDGAKPGEVVVEKGIPADAQADQDEASGAGAAATAPAAAEPAAKKR